jgi:proline iminopeptidase
LVVVGRYDYVTPVEASEEVARGIPNSKLVIFEHSGHSPGADEPERFEKVLSEWLDIEGLHEIK